MDFLLNDEIFDFNNDELLQSSHLESEQWPRNILTTLDDENSFSNDGYFDVNLFSTSFDEDNKSENETHTRTNIYQVSPERSSRNLTPDNLQNKEMPLKSVTLLHQRKFSLNSERDLNSPIIHDGHQFAGRLKPTFTSPKIFNDQRGLTKFKKPDNITFLHVSPNLTKWGDRTTVDRTKYSLSPNNSSPESITPNGHTNNVDQSYLSYTNSFQNRLYKVKYKSHKDDSYSSKSTYSNRIFQSPIPQSGILILSDEEKRTLLSEGYHIPTRLPLTRLEERNLKKVRRKIKNKISAQESRRKKKEYIEALEKKVEIFAHENNDLRKKLEHQENNNKSLIGQLRHLQNMFGRTSSNTTSTCVMVFLFCFSLILVGFPDMNQPMKLPQSVLVVGNIHKCGYGLLLRRERSQMTGMQRYFPPDITAFVNSSSNKEFSAIVLNNSMPNLSENKGNEPLDSLESPVSGQRKSILLGNVKEEKEECVQYGPRYLWWLLQSPNFNTDESIITPGTSATDNLDPLNHGDNLESSLLLVSHPRVKNDSQFRVQGSQRLSNMSVGMYRVPAAIVAT